MCVESYQSTLDTIVVLQAAVRRHQAVRRYTALRAAASTIQARFR